MKLSLMTFTMALDGLKKILDAPLLTRMIRNSGFHEADIMELEFQVYGEEKLLSELKQNNIHCGCLITNQPFYVQPESVKDGVEKALRLAKRAGAEYLMIVPGDGSEQDQKICERLTRNEIIKIAVEHYQQACIMARHYGIKVIMENTPQAHKPLSAAKDVLNLLNQVPELGLAFDTANFRTADTKADEFAAYELLKDRIVRVHLKDVRIGDFPAGEKCADGQTMKAVFIGSGVIPIGQLMCRMNQDGFQGTYAVEYAAPSDTHGAGHELVIAAYRTMIERMSLENKQLCPCKTIPGIHIPVSVLFFGTAVFPMQIGACAEYLLDMASAYGINAFDCARGYGGAEGTLGKWIKARGNRSQVVILSKCGNTAADGSVHIDRNLIQKELEESLKQLQTDYIDIYMLHRDDPKTPVSEIIETMNEMKAAGKIRVFGASNWTVERIIEANAYAEKHGLCGFTVSSPHYSLAKQVNDPWGGGCVSLTGKENEENRRWYVQTQMPVIAYSSLSRGFLSGEFKSGEWDRAKMILDAPAQKGYLCEGNMLLLKQAEHIAKESGMSVAQVALQYVLSSPMNVFAIVSVSNENRMAENIQAAQSVMALNTWLSFRDF